MTGERHRGDVVTGYSICDSWEELHRPVGEDEFDADIRVEHRRRLPVLQDGEPDVDRLTGRCIGDRVERGDSPAARVCRRRRRPDDERNQSGDDQSRENERMTVLNGSHARPTPPSMSQVPVGCVLAVDSAWRANANAASRSAKPSTRVITSPRCHISVLPAMRSNTG